MKIYLASDHAGFELKEIVKKFLQKSQYDCQDMGTHSAESVSWAEFGAKAAQKVSENPENTKGILICGSGIGMSMIANKFRGIRAAQCHDRYTAEMSRRHNNSNILTLGARILNKKKALRIVEIWLNTAFEGGRHQKRIEYLEQIIEKKNFK
jgi:ribose 5-phosphate isomerase B